MNETHKYDNIINLPHRQSKMRPHMSMENRAAQFSPFATLTGHEEAILETQRLTQEQAELTEEDALYLSRQTAVLMQHLSHGERPAIAVDYFLPDEKKAGGSYVTYTGALRRIDETAGVFLMTDGTRIDMKAISQIRMSDAE